MGINQYIQIGTKIKNARLTKGIPQKEMAQMLSLSVSTYSNYENNYREPKLDLIHKICDILDTTLDELLGLSNLDTSAQEEIYDYLLKDDVAIVKKKIIVALKNLNDGKTLTTEEYNLIKGYINSKLFDEMRESLSEHTKKLVDNIEKIYDFLNPKGQEKANEQIDRLIEQLELLAKVPEYRKDSQEKTAAPERQPQDGQDT